MDEKIESSAPHKIRDRLKPLPDGAFQFACHPKVSCFTECCRDLNLMLTPYDVLRLARHLSLSTTAFLDTYTDVVVAEGSPLPSVILKMQEDARRLCPFVSTSGCLVYSDRPSACRTYPLARASRKHRVHGTVLESYYLVVEDHCRGFDEPRSWTIEQWIADQGLEPYHRMNNNWMDIVTHPRVRQGLTEKQIPMFYMASYDLDRFRSFVFQSRFLEMFDTDAVDVERARTDDVALCELAVSWLKFFLLGEGPLRPKKSTSEPA
ncbi:YkgJ family cysteine cluster protein [Desulfosoma caldarium]|uniref:YkgJ family cysteine cluster protein n=1 Tax=Desulfosoma caldarium TaxID=610254 RepID=A0A3N1UP69_9BACT|nr:YkgJ family cysteine cluster protein [Desulfosoma caldarium]ROQ91199.1 hypothetical protein EDC27_2484 [Desulfosoma caldarium]